jgi:predicted nucleic acid-binding protein
MRVQRLLLAGDRAVVLPLWRLELANGFAAAERRGILTPSDTAQILQNFQSVLARPLKIANRPLPVQRVIININNTAREFHLTAYDGEYLDTASAHQLPLATLDRRLEEAAMRAGISLLG